MMVSTRGRYALRMMADLAEHAGGGSVALKDIAERQDISKKYLEQIIPVLTGAGLLRTVRGAHGGYSLAKAPEQYTVGEIVRAAEGSMAPVACMEISPNQCPRCDHCETLPVWTGLQKVVDEYLNGITLADVIGQSGKNGKNI